MRLVERIEAEENERKQILADCTNDEERINLRKKFIEKKIQGQKEAKNLMAQHKREADFLEKKIAEQLEQFENHGKDKHEDDGEDNHEEGEAGDGDDEDEKNDNEANDEDRAQA